MKKLFIGFLLFVACGLSASFASDADLFAYDQTALNQEFNELNTLETFVLANNGITFNDLMESNSELLATVKMNSFSPNGINQTMFDFDFKSFLWGFCCWPVGLFTVIFKDDKTSDQKLSYWIGLGVAVITSGSSSSLYL